MARPFIPVTFESGDGSQAHDGACNAGRGGAAFRRKKDPFIFRKMNVSETQLR